jgi:hypothetical protein
MICNCFLAGMTSALFKFLRQYSGRWRLRRVRRRTTYLLSTSPTKGGYFQSKSGYINNEQLKPNGNNRHRHRARCMEKGAKEYWTNNSVSEGVQSL